MKIRKKGAKKNKESLYKQNCMEMKWVISNHNSARGAISENTLKLNEKILKEKKKIRSKKTQNKKKV